LLVGFKVRSGIWPPRPPFARLLRIDYNKQAKKNLFPRDLHFIQISVDGKSFLSGRLSAGVKLSINSRPFVLLAPLLSHPSPSMRKLFNSPSKLFPAQKVVIAQSQGSSSSSRLSVLSCILKF